MALPALVQAIRASTQTQSVLALEAGSRARGAESYAWNRVTARGTILLAEDNKVNQMLAIKTLEKGGYKVLIASNGIEAVHAARNPEVDLVLMDIQMPEMDGFQATARIRDVRMAKGLDTLPIIAMTAHALKGDRERCLNAGMTDYISKPIKPSDLLAMVSRYSSNTVA